MTAEKRSETKHEGRDMRILGTEEIHQQGCDCGQCRAQKCGPDCECIRCDPDLAPMVGDDDEPFHIDPKDIANYAGS